MSELLSNIIEKVSSYNLFNNFLPGVITCYLIEKTTHFSILSNVFWQNFFIYYFVGLIVSRIGSILIEKTLRKIKYYNIKKRKKEKFLNVAGYKDYVAATKNQPIIETLSETNNVYRTVISVFLTVLLAKVYDMLVYNLLSRFICVSQDLVFITLCVFMIILFVFSYRKQTTYISKRIEFMKSEKENKER